MLNLKKMFLNNNKFLKSIQVSKLFFYAFYFLRILIYEIEGNSTVRLAKKSGKATYL